MNTKKTESKSLKDTNRIEKMNADLTAFCGLLNESINAMKERGVIVGAITDETVKELAMLNADGIIHLDLRVIKNLDFDHADELLNSDRQFENSKIWGAELYPD